MTELVNTDLNNFEDLKLLREEFDRLGFFKFKTFSVYSALVHGEDEMNCNAVMAPREIDVENKTPLSNYHASQSIPKENVFDPDQQYIDFESEEINSSRVLSFHDENGDPNDMIHTMNRGQYLQKHFDGIKKDETMAVIACQDFGIRSKIKNVLEGKGLLGFRSVFCSAQTGMMIFDPYGDLYNCWETVGMDRHKVGSYRNGIQLIEEELEHWYGRNISKTPACSKCKYAFFCGGGCQARALREGRGYNSPYCDGYPKTFQTIALDTYKKHVKEKSTQEIQISQS